MNKLANTARLLFLVYSWLQKYEYTVEISVSKYKPQRCHTATDRDIRDCRCE
jgi:hypothetical protein